MKKTMIFVVVLFLLPAAYAQPSEDPYNILMRTRKLQCEFGKGTMASWDEGKLKLEVTDFGAGGKLVFDSIDTKKGKAQLVAILGTSDVIVLTSVSGITFIEKTENENFNFTTVFGTYDSKHSFIAVTSRHIDFLWPIPSQYHGTCQPLDLIPTKP